MKMKDALVSSSNGFQSEAPSTDEILEIRPSKIDTYHHECLPNLSFLVSLALDYWREAKVAQIHYVATHAVSR